VPGVTSPASEFNERRRRSLAARRNGFTFEVNERRADVARRLRDLISTLLRHQYSNDTLVTTEEKLVSEFGSSRNSVREALDLLNQENSITRTRGRGSVLASTVEYGWIDQFSDSEREHMSHEILRVAVLDHPPTRLVDWFALRDDEVILLIERVTSSNGEPTALRTVYLRTDHAEDLLQADFTGDLYEVLERLGLVVGDAVLYVGGALADERLGELLEVSEGAPLLLLENHTSDAEGRLLFISYGRMRADRRGIVLSKSMTTARRDPLDL